MDCGKPRNISVRISVLRAEIRIRSEYKAGVANTRLRLPLQAVGSKLKNSHETRDSHRDALLIKKILLTVVVLNFTFKPVKWHLI